jgi:hypothetical protein
VQKLSRVVGLFKEDLIGAADCFDQLAVNQADDNGLV